LRTRELEPQLAALLDQPIRYLDYLHARHGKTKPKTEPGGQHLIRQYPDVLWIVLELGDVPISI
jgi:hypothetical protein